MDALYSLSTISGTKKLVVQEPRKCSYSEIWVGSKASISLNPFRLSPPWSGALINRIAVKLEYKRTLYCRDCWKSLGRLSIALICRLISRLLSAQLSVEQLRAASDRAGFTLAHSIFSTL